MMIEVQDRYYVEPDEPFVTSVGLRDAVCMACEDFPVVFIDWSRLKRSGRKRIVKLPTSLVKEGPKAIVKWREA